MNFMTSHHPERRLSTPISLKDRRFPTRRRHDIPQVRNTSQPDDGLVRFRVRWAGDPELLRRRISARVEWGPFDVDCAHCSSDSSDQVSLSVKYDGPKREEPLMMKSFWRQVERVAPLEKDAA